MKFPDFLFKVQDPHNNDSPALKEDLAKLTEFLNSLPKENSDLELLPSDLGSPEGRDCLEALIIAKDHYRSLANKENAYRLSVVQRINYILEVLSQVLKGDLNTRVKDIQADELGILEVGLNGVLDNLENKITTITSINKVLESQSSAISNSSALIQKIIASIQNIAMHVEDASPMVSQLLELTKTGGENISHSVQEINSVKDSASSILKMVSIISSVTEQTSLLSLNAAIEAAHAGEQGKGFAVVADEIRNLSQKTEENALNISQAIQAIVDKIYLASETSQKSGEGFTEIEHGIVILTNSIKETTQNMNDLSILSKNVSREVFQVMEQLMDLIQQSKNAAKLLEGDAA
ncbi:methyl-accepting chemotaxis protein [bacterium]|nr:methyl-accepting chemotaxis protein [bacterium]